MLKFLRFISTLLLVLLLILLAKNIHINDDEKYTKASDEYIDKLALIDVADDELIPILNGDRLILDEYPKMSGGNIYLPLDFVKQYFNDDFYWDSAEKVLTLTTINKVIRMNTDALTYYINDKPMRLSIPIMSIDDKPYIPLSLVEKFSDFKFESTDISTLLIENTTLNKKVVTVNADELALRTLRDDTTDKVDIARRGEEFLYLSSDKVWTKVLSREGLIAYAKTSELELKSIEGDKSKKEVYNYEKRMSFKGGLNLTWHLVSNVNANKYLSKKLEGVHSLDVISPTWFAFKKADGTLSNIADLDYVREAHSRGIQVWALFSNKFDKKLTHEVLASTKARENVIKQLLYFASIYELDGINVDFEMVAKEDGENFVQFMKELTPYLKAENLVVSVDTYVPSAWTKHYGRDKLGEIVDYMMVMTYDEHWSTSKEAGSVASLAFVDKGIRQTLEVVPSDKVVMGLPFYTRIWKEDKNGKISSKARGMDAAFKHFDEKKARFSWLEDIGQFYAEYKEDGEKYMLWLEDVNSINAKMDIYHKYDLAGVASWQVGLENDKVWDSLRKHLNK